MSQTTLIANRYRLEERLGQGGMGTVYKAITLDTGESVAIKALHQEESHKFETLLERFNLEGEILRRLNHPNIVKMLETVHENGRHYIIMELVTGGNLQDVMSVQKKMPVERVLSIGLELADALTRAHHLKVVHRDIKPANVLLAADGTPRLTDFGVAQVGYDSKLTEDGMVVGTLVYLSPEALRGYEVDARTDIWAFGVMLFEMLAGKLPFYGTSMAEVVNAILNERPPHLETLRDEVPIALVDLINRMLEKNRERRLPSVRMIGAELEAIQEGRTGLLPTARPAPSAKANLHTKPTEAQTTYLRKSSSRFVEQDDVLRETKSAPPRPGNLPQQPTAFVGRDAELEQLAELLADDDVRLVTILSAGGMGKTRLGIACAEREQDRFMDGVFFIPLAPLTDPAQILLTLAETLKFSFKDGDDPKAQLLAYLKARRMLLVFDNFEHLIEGAGLVADILRDCPDIKVLATSRERLNLRGETVFTIGGIDFPTMEHARDETLDNLPAIKLFVQSARRAQLDFELMPENRDAIAQICYRVRGMPLAIELAAGWVEMLEVGEIAQEINQSLDFLETDMRDMPERHRSIRAVFDYSWQLLSADERQIFASFAVFHGGFTRDAAQSVVDANLRTLNAFTNKSLITRELSGRYMIHELLRQYAAEKLAEQPALKDDLRAHHADYYTRYLAENELNLKGTRQTETAKTMDQEMENIRAAWAWAIETASVEAMANALETLNRFYDMRTWFQEGETAFREAAASLQRLNTNDPHTVKVLGELLARQSWFARRFKSPLESRRLSEESIKLLDNIGATTATAFPLNTLGCLARDAADYTEAKRLIGAALELYRAAGDTWGIGFMLYGLGDAAQKNGDYEEATAYFEESIIVCEGMGDMNGAAWAYNGLGNVTRRMGQYAAARQYFEESLSIARRMGFQAGILTNTLLSLAWLAWRYLGDYEAALERVETALKVLQKVGAPNEIATASVLHGFANATLGNYDKARASFKEGLRLAEQVNATSIMLDAIIGLSAMKATLLKDKQMAVARLLWAKEQPQLNPEMLEVIETYLQLWRKDLAPRAFDEAAQLPPTLSLTGTVKALS